jgi:hypothetical protein
MPTKVQASPEKVAPPPEVGNRYLEIIVDQDGTTHINAVGFNGKGCREASKGIEIALGRVQDRKDKSGPDCHQTIRKA